LREGTKCLDREFLMCPSARPSMPGSQVFGLNCGTVPAPHVDYLERSLPASGKVMALCGSTDPAQVFRFAAFCERHACREFDGTDCRVGKRLVTLLPTVVNSLPRCAIRPVCRWFHQEGKAACMRCPQIMIDTRSPFDPAWHKRVECGDESQDEHRMARAPGAALGEVKHDGEE
jgi:hypothetical protein